MGKVIPIKERRILREAGVRDLCFPGPWGSSWRRPAPGQSSAGALPALWALAGPTRWHCAPAARAAGAARWGTAVRAAAGRYKPGSNAVRQLHPARASLGPCWQQESRLHLPPRHRAAPPGLGLVFSSAASKSHCLPHAAGDTRDTLDSAADQDVPTAAFAADKIFIFKEEDPVSST